MLLMIEKKLLDGGKIFPSDFIFRSFKLLSIAASWQTEARISTWVYVIQQHGSTWFESRPQNSSSSSKSGPHTSVG